MAMANMQKKFGIDRTHSSENMIEDGHTHAHRQTRSSQYMYFTPL